MTQEAETPSEIVPFNEDAAKDLDKIRRLTTLMDTRFHIPGTKIQFGLDPILGLIPGVGDMVTLIVSGLLVVLMGRHGVKGQVLLIMLWNVALDFLVGAIPIVGWIADVRIKANSRNLRLLGKHYVDGTHQRGFWNVLFLVLLVVITLIWLAFWGIVSFFQWIF